MKFHEWIKSARGSICKFCGAVKTKENKGQSCSAMGSQKEWNKPL